MFQLDIKKSDWQMATHQSAAVLRGMPADISKEFLRKSLHIMIALVPSMASFNIVMAFSALAAGILIYTYTEILRIQSNSLSFISTITVKVSRDRDFGHFVYGPVTLAMGAMLALMLYPHPAASLAIYALAFGDSISSIAGKMIPSAIIPFSGGKTIAGSASCFMTVLVIAYMFQPRMGFALLIALSATILEALPSRDLDNIIIPVGTGFIATQLMQL